MNGKESCGFDVIDEPRGARCAMRSTRRDSLLKSSHISLKGKQIIVLSSKKRHLPSGVTGSEIENQNSCDKDSPSKNLVFSFFS